MAKRRKKSSRRRKSLREGYTLSRRGRKRSRSRRKKGLSEMFTPGGMREAGKGLLSGGAGGGIAFLADMLVGTEKPGLRALANLGSAVLFAGAFKMPNTGAGIAGAYAKSLFEGLYNKTLSEMENEDYADENALDQYPDALDENGTPMYLAEDGNFYYLDEFELADDGNYYLSETGQAPLYPSYYIPAFNN